MWGFKGEMSRFSRRNGGKNESDERRGSNGFGDWKKGWKVCKGDGGCHASGEGLGRSRR